MQGRIVFAAGMLLASLCAQAAFDQPLNQARSVPTDAAGRPLKDQLNRNLEYTTAPAPGNAVLQAKSFASPAAKSGKKSRAVRMQSTGISPSYQAQWRTSRFGTGIGKTGIWPVDADADGDQDFVVSGGTAFGASAVWSIVSFDASTHGYEIVWQSVPVSADPFGHAQGVSALRVVHAQSGPFVWVGRADGRLEIVNALTRETMATLQPSNTAITDFAIADADNDGETDVVVATATETSLYDPQNYDLKRTLAYGGSRVAVGNIDDDAALEVAFDTGNVIEVGADSVTLEWSSPSSFGSRIELADIDADGRDELVGAESWYLIRAWDLELQSLKWSYTADLDINAMRVIDVAGDSTPEIVYGDGQWGEIHVLDAGTREELWSIHNPEHGVTDIAIFDADGDGAHEILWGSGWSSTGPDYLYVHDLTTRAFEWQNEMYDGPYYATDLGDVDADGTLEMVVASAYNNLDSTPGAVWVFDATTNELEWTSLGVTSDGAPWPGARTLKLLNVDADPQLEIVMGADYLGGALHVIDGLTHERQLEAYYDDGSPLSVMDVGDLTGDGVPEIVAGNTVVHTGSPGAFMYVLDPTTGAQLWRSAALATGFSQVTDVLVSDVGTPGPDIIGVSSFVHVVRWSDHRHVTSATSGYQSVTTVDVAANAGVEILAGTTTGTIDVLDGETLAVLDTRTVCSSAIGAMQMYTSNRVALTCNEELIVYDLSTGLIADSTPAGATSLGMYGSLARASIGNHSVILAGGSQIVKFVDVSNNNLPVLTLPAVSMHWRAGSIDVQLSASDADNDPLRFQMMRVPAQGTAVWIDATSGSLRYSNTGEHGLGVNGVMIRVYDGYQYSSGEPLLITLTNTAPTATSTRHDINPGRAMNGRVSASDPDGDLLTYAISRLPTRGTLSFDVRTGDFQYSGTGNTGETDSFTFSVSDGAAQAESTVEFRYVAPSRSGGGGGGGGALGGLMSALLALLACAQGRARARSRRATANSRRSLISY